MAKNLGEDLEVDMTYFDRLADEAIDTINKFGNFDEFTKIGE
jgi:hypothetical protein